MKATFALLTDTHVYNFARKLAWDIHRTYRTGTAVCRLPPHVSLKQPFEISNLSFLEDFMSELASDIHPFEIQLSKLQLVPTTINDMDTGILWLDVEETDYLRQLHNRLNQDLLLRFGNTQAPFDGTGYHFHLTIAIAGQPLEVYRQIYSKLSQLTVNLRYTLNEIAMFVYDDNSTLNGDYITYKILPIGNK